MALRKGKGRPKPYFKCGICPKTFRDEVLFQKHMDIVHGQFDNWEALKAAAARDAVATVCDAQPEPDLEVEVEPALVGRTRPIRDPDRPYQCPICQYTTLSEKWLQTHVQRKHNKNPSKYIKDFIARANATQRDSSRDVREALREASRSERRSQSSDRLLSRHTSKRSRSYSPEKTSKKRPSVLLNANDEDFLEHNLILTSLNSKYYTGLRTITVQQGFRLKESSKQLTKYIPGHFEMLLRMFTEYLIDYAIKHYQHSIDKNYADGPLPKRLKRQLMLDDFYLSISIDSDGFNVPASRNLGSCDNFYLAFEDLMIEVQNAAGSNNMICSDNFWEVSINLVAKGSSLIAAGKSRDRSRSVSPNRLGSVVTNSCVANYRHSDFPEISEAFAVKTKSFWNPRTNPKDSKIPSCVLQSIAAGMLRKPNVKWGKQAKSRHYKDSKNSVKMKLICKKLALIANVSYNEAIDPVKLGDSLQDAIDICAKEGIIYQGKEFQLYGRKLMILTNEHRTIADYAYYGGIGSEIRSHVGLIIICVSQGHCVYVKNYMAMITRRQYCLLCLKHFTTSMHGSQHNCQMLCSSCGSRKQQCNTKYILKEEQRIRFCRVCAGLFMTTACYNYHLANNRCKTKKKCPLCLKYIHKIKKKNEDNSVTMEWARHDLMCEQARKCYQCGIVYPNQLVKRQHTCLIRSSDPVEFNPKKFRLIVFDFETYCDGKLSNDDKKDNLRHDSRIQTGLHKPYCVVLLHLCDKCIDMPNVEDDCTQCGKRLHYFYDDDGTQNVFKLFIDHLFGISKEKEKGKRNYGNDTQFIAHNSSRFDIHILLRLLFETYECLPQNPVICMAGNKCISVTFKGLKFIDSCLLVPAKLSQLPKMFGLDLTFFSKGDFPHSFMTSKTLTYKGQIPGIEYFNLEKKTDDEKQIFYSWYKTKAYKLYDIKKECLEYCLQDCSVLARSISKHREISIKLTSMNPYCFSTVAQYANMVWRSTLNNIEEENLPEAIPPIGHSRKFSNSKKALRYLKYYAEKNKLVLHTADHGNEWVLGNNNYPVDACVMKNDEVVSFINISGCFYHSCQYSSECKTARKMFPGAYHPLKKFMTNKEVFEMTYEILNIIEKDSGLPGKMIWEHEIDNDECFKTWCEEQDDKNSQSQGIGNTFEDMIESRDALYGGRTEVRLPLFEQYLF